MADRILMTHVGSLPRGAELTELLLAAERGEAVDPARFDTVVSREVDDVVRRQVAAGIDLVSDDEMSKISYAAIASARA